MTTETETVEPLKLHDKFRKIAEEISLLEHEEAALNLVIALLTNNHIAYFGPPGTGKSHMSKEFCKRIVGTHHFYKLLSRDMPPNDLLVSDYVIKEWIGDDGRKHVQFAYNTTGMLPDCEIAFLDEVFKANSTTLNKLLDIILDRRFMMNGEMMDAKTQTVVMASNEMPEDELLAFYDRILFRHVISNVVEPQSFFALLEFEYNADSPTTVNIDEVHEAQDLIRLVDVPKNVRHKLWELKKELFDAGFDHSGRRWKACKNIIQAEAWLNGRNKAIEEDLEVLQHCLWHTPDKASIKKVRDVVLQAVNPLKQQILDKFDEALDVIREVYGQKTEDERVKNAIEANTKLKKLGKHMDNLITQIRDKGKPVAKFEELRHKLTVMQSELVTDCLGVEIKVTT